MNILRATELLDERERLEEELEHTQKQLENYQDHCDHIKICIGWDGLYKYRDSSYHTCLLCGCSDPDTRYRVLDASDYMSDKYSHGELYSYRSKRIKELRGLLPAIVEANPKITNEELVNMFKEIIQ